MLGHMKKPPINKKMKISKCINELYFRFEDKTIAYTNIPTPQIEKILEQIKLYRNDEEDLIPWRDSFKNELKTKNNISEYKESAMMVKGARFKEGLSQKKLAKMLGIEQSNLSKIENAKRPVRKAMAKKLEQIFKINYKIFLSESL